METAVAFPWRQLGTLLVDEQLLTLDELEQGLASIAVPVRHHIGTLAAMIGISGPTFRLNKARRQALLPTVLAAAAEIERALAR